MIAVEFIRLEPTTLPTAIECSFFTAPAIEVANSGRLVPTATIVSPVIFAESECLAESDATPNNQSAANKEKDEAADHVKENLSPRRY